LPKKEVLPVEILPGDVLFVWGDGFIDDAIEFVSRGPSHCALFLDGQTVAEAQAGKVSGPTSLSEYLFTNNRLEVWTDITLTNEERAKIVTDAKNHFGIHYDYLAILVELVRFEGHVPINSFHEGKRRICSSYVNDRAKTVNHNWLGTPTIPAPIDLLNGGKLTKKGVLANGK
jgi:hypothetical protein